MPIFPGYMFCKFDPEQKLPILMSPGVVSILGSFNGPIAVPDSEIASVQTMLKSDCWLAHLWPFLQQGQFVLVERGSLSRE